METKKHAFDKKKHLMCRQPRKKNFQLFFVCVFVLILYFFLFNDSDCKSNERETKKEDLRQVKKRKIKLWRNDKTLKRKQYFFLSCFPFFYSYQNRKLYNSNENRKYCVQPKERPTKKTDNIYIRHKMFAITVSDVMCQTAIDRKSLCNSIQSLYDTQSNELRQSSCLCLSFSFTHYEWRKYSMSMNFIVCFLS